MPAKTTKAAPATKKPSTHDIVTVSKVGPPSPKQAREAFIRGRSISLEQFRTKLGWK